MRKITLVCAGRLKEKYLQMAMREYLQRLQPYTIVDVKEIREEAMPDNPMPAQKEQVLEREGERLLKLVPEKSFLCVLDVCGEELTSEEFSEKLSHLAVQGQSHVTFLIGSAFGLSAKVRRAADWRMSLSKLTFTHQMARVILIEQIYRAFKIMRKEKYHW